MKIFPEANFDKLCLLINLAFLQLPHFILKLKENHQFRSLELEFSILPFNNHFNESKLAYTLLNHNLCFEHQKQLLIVLHFK